MAIPTVATRVMGVVHLVEPWKGDGGSAPVTEFFGSIHMAAELGRLSAKDKIYLAKIKLKGPARTFWTP
jgi:hypothetical protein